MGCPNKFDLAIWALDNHGLLWIFHTVQMGCPVKTHYLLNRGQTDGRPLEMQATNVSAQWSMVAEPLYLGGVARW